MRVSLIPWHSKTLYASLLRRLKNDVVGPASLVYQRRSTKRGLIGIERESQSVPFFRVGHLAAAFKRPFFL